MHPKGIVDFNCNRATSHINGTCKTEKVHLTFFRIQGAANSARAVIGSMMSSLHVPVELLR